MTRNVLNKATHPQSPLKPNITTLIFDLGDVLFTWSDSTPKSPLPPKIVKGILRSLTWFEYEKGNLTESQTYGQVAQEFAVDASEVKASFEAARDSLKSDPMLLQLIRSLKDSGHVIYAMSNISAPDWEFLKTRADLSDWALFDRVFPSAEAHDRKPNIGFYQHVINETGLNPSNTVFVDDRIENVVSARSAGMHGIVFDDINNVIRQLKNLCEDPIHRARSFLYANKKCLNTVSTDGTIVSENFSQLLILEAIGDESLVDFVRHEGRFNFFQGEAKLIMTNHYPDDFDTTSIGLTVVPYIDDKTRNRVMDEILAYQSEDGIVLVYFDHKRPRIDPVVCVNVLTLFYRYGRGHQLQKTLDWVEQVLINRACASGTFYYATEEQFLFFLSRLIQSSPDVRQRLEGVFKRRVVERFGADGDALAMAMRIHTAASVGLVDHVDLDKLFALQQNDGSWRDSAFYRFPSARQLASNDGLTTAIAIQAIQAAERLREDGNVL
ncbi:hypothetical protein AcV7_003308 [Taiwanofungus camphoratus]|nr:hypothetical protein AcV7_003308 [Antrodia cinnamomea]